MMLCHGGAGVFHATLRAGIPCIISPLIGDQFAHAKLVTAKKLGCQAGALLTNITQEDIENALRTILEDEGDEKTIDDEKKKNMSTIQANCKAFKERVEMESPVHPDAGGAKKLFNS